jgi:hypothetical protein
MSENPQDPSLLTNDLPVRFRYHPPTPTKVPVFEEIRSVLWTAAERVVDLTPESREQEQAVVKIEEALSWAIAAVARR